MWADILASLRAAMREFRRLRWRRRHTRARPDDSPF